MTALPIGFPAVRSQAAFESFLGALRDSSDRLRQEAITERKQDVALDLSGAVAEVLGLEKRLADIGGYRESLTLAGTRADVAQKSLATLSRLVEEMASEGTVAAQAGTLTGLTVISASAETALATAAASLNVSVGERSVFAGDAGGGPAIAATSDILAALSARLGATSTPAETVDALIDAFEDAGDVFDTVIYSGGSGDAPRVEIAPGERLAYQIRADNPAIRDVLRGFSAMALAYEPSQAFSEAQRDALLRQGLDDLRNGSASLASLTGSLGGSEARIGEAIAQLSTEEALLTQRYNEIAGVDGLLKAAEFQFAEQQLERLFLTSSRIASLSLSSFL